MDRRPLPNDEADDDDDSTTKYVTRPISWEKFNEWRSKKTTYTIFMNQYKDRIRNWWCETPFRDIQKDRSPRQIVFLFLNKDFIDVESLKKWTTDDDEDSSSLPSDWKWNETWPSNPFFREGKYHKHVADCRTRTKCICKYVASIIDPNLIPDKLLGDSDSSDDDDDCWRWVA